jgi:hypothetical protein
MANPPSFHRLTPIFIGGTGRSGTTVLGDLLNEHSQIRTSNPTEIKFLANRGGFLDVVFGSMSSNVENREKVSLIHWRTYRERKARDKAARERRYQEFTSKLWAKWWQIDAPPPHGPGLQAGISREVFEGLLNNFYKRMNGNTEKVARKFLDSFIASQSGRKDERYWAETTPMNISYSRRLLQIYPEAKFIVMKRDSRDVIASLLKKDWGPKTPLEGVEWIEARLRADQEALAFIPSSQVLTLHLEELVSENFEASYAKLLGFLEIADEPRMREFHRSKMTAENASSGRWKSEIDTPEFISAIEAMNLRLQEKKA